MSKQKQLPQYKEPQRKLEKLLLSQGYARTQWDAELALMSDAVKAEFAGLVDDCGVISKGSRRKYQAWKAEHLAKVAAAKKKSEAVVAAAEPPANETGENASE